VKDHPVTEPTTDSSAQQASAGSPGPRDPKAEERKRFENWLMQEQLLDATWNEARNCYDEFPAHLAFKAWQAARPKRTDVSQLVKLSAKLIHPDTLRKLSRLEEESGRTLGRRALSDALAAADENLKLMAIELARVAYALSDQAPAVARHEDKPRGTAPSVEAAYEMGAKGGQGCDAERLAFEAWMRGHCWALCATWSGTGYRSDAEQGGQLCPWALRTRQLWAAWRDRAALARQNTEPR
jgi:hypothetical protein